MSALNTAIILYTVRNPEEGVKANQELLRLQMIESAANDINEWLKRSNLEGTAHQRYLEEALRKTE